MFEKKDVNEKNLSLLKKPKIRHERRQVASFLKGKDGENAFFYNVNNLKQSPETCH